ncbi:hypothetical protein ATE73_00525 [Sphingopyxis sp. H077]|nr:hypothetical protein ATE76_02710 [Sphingopyxis sp. H093]KTE30183.1 hypothetical protein ATE75_03935 [Sphingopyxis sp. H080]KTE49102.1 hypothetical protein ATE73_00525 [Sphingopyxis sp. H077]
MVQSTISTVHLFVQSHINPQAKSPAAILAIRSTASRWGARIANGLGLYGAMSAVVPYVSATLNAGMRIPAVAGAIRGAMERKANGSSGGPSDEARAAGSTSVIARAWSDSDELLHTTILTGVDGFSFTANFLAWASIQAAGGITGTGALGPVQAFGVEALEEGVRESGLVLVN